MFPIKNPQKSRSVVHGPPARARWQPAPSVHWGLRRGRRAAALWRRRRGWAQRQAGRCAHGGGLVGKGRPRVSPALHGRNGRVAAFAAARLTGRARGRAGRKNADNSPAHPTSLFSPQSARGEPRPVGCSALSTTSARSTALFCGFSYKNFAGTGPIACLRGVLLHNPCRGTRCACFRDWARVSWGSCLGVYLRESVFWRFVLQLFRHTGLESVPTLQGG